MDPLAPPLLPGEVTHPRLCLGDPILGAVHERADGQARCTLTIPLPAQEENDEGVCARG